MTQQQSPSAGFPRHEPDPRDWLAAIIEGSEDAIISKDLSGHIQSWNPGATRLFGYLPEEVIGRPITILIPEDRLDEETHILSRIRSGHRVDHFETIRRRKDGSLVELSLTISPIRDAAGIIVGASKIARDISERRLAEERQRMLLGEMQHRVKNLFAVATAIVSLTARSEVTPDALVRVIHARLSALARAHELTMESWQGGDGGRGRGDLLALVETVLEPYRINECIRVEGDHVPTGGKATTNIALLIYELATNAAKHGALSVSQGRLVVTIRNLDGMARIDWAEYGGPAPRGDVPPGFGSQLENSLAMALQARITRDWQPTGLVAHIEIPSAALAE